MIPERPALEQRLLTALDASPSRIPVLIGGCGMGRTSLLRRMASRLGNGRSQYVDIERALSTPERFCAAIIDESPYTPPASNTNRRNADPKEQARTAFETLVRFLCTARAGAERPLFLIDEILELHTFDNFPGMRGALRELVAALAACRNRFVLTSRYTNRARRLFDEASARFELMPIPRLTADEISALLLRHGVGHTGAERDELGHGLHVLTDGRPGYVRPLIDMLRSRHGIRQRDPVDALIGQLAVDAPLWRRCRFSYELRLHRARGYSVLKAILQVLAAEEGLTLSEIAARMGRTPGSTKDYLVWLDDVDLVTGHKKRYSFIDPLLPLWVRLYCRPGFPADQEVAREVKAYAAARLPRTVLAQPPDRGPRTVGKASRGATQDIIEID